jgi:hypothetical protein
LRPPGEDVDRAVVVGPEEGAVGRRRLGQLLDLVAQVGHCSLACLEGEGQLLVLRDGLGQLPLGLEQLLLELACSTSLIVESRGELTTIWSSLSGMSSLPKGAERSITSP